MHLITGLGTGGAERMLFRLLGSPDSLLRRNTVPLVVSLNDLGTYGPRLLDAGVSTHALGLKRGLTGWTGVFRLVALVRRFEPDIVQTWLSHADFMGWLVTRPLRRRPRLYWNLRNSNMEFSQYGSSIGTLVRLLARVSGGVDGIIHNAHSGRRFYERLGFRNDNWIWIPNGLDFAAADEERRRFDMERPTIRQELDIPTGARVIALVARGDPMKDHRTAIEALSALLSRGVPAVLLLVGKGLGSAESPLGRHAEGCGVPPGSIRWIGETSAVGRFLGVADIVWLTSRFGEGFPNVLLEALAAGRPCVATDVGDSAMVLEPEWPVVPPADPAALADATVTVLDISPQEHQDRVDSAYRRIRGDYALTRIEERYWSVYASVQQGLYDSH